MSDVQMALDMCNALCPDTEVMTTLTIPGPPKSKARVRWTRSGRRYAPDTADETRTGFYLRRSFPEPLDGGIAVGCIFYRPNRSRIDVDNMLKHVFDSANKIVWHDDSQVNAVLGLLELDAANPRTVVMIGQRESTLSRVPLQIACEVCGNAFSVPPGSPKKLCSQACMHARRASNKKLNFCDDCGKQLASLKPKRCRACDVARRTVSAEPGGA